MSRGLIRGVKIKFEFWIGIVFGGRSLFCAKIIAMGDKGVGLELLYPFFGESIYELEHTYNGRGILNPFLLCQFQSKIM